jgi:hypothetical protein
MQQALIFNFAQILYFINDNIYLVTCSYFLQTLIQQITTLHHKFQQILITPVIWIDIIFINIFYHPFVVFQGYKPFSDTYFQ